MLTPVEFVAKHITPYIRGLAAVMLYEMGYSQPRIARLLGVSQPMVAKYISAGRSRMLEKLSEAGVSRELAEEIVRGYVRRLTAGDRFGALSFLALVELSLLAYSSVCSAYEKVVGVQGACSSVRSLSESLDPIVAEVEAAVRELTSIPGIHMFIPEVGSNVVAAREGADSIMDVVAVPGRIVKSGSQVVAVGRPTYGGSEFMAKLLLVASKRWSGIRAAVALKRCREVLKELEESGLSVCHVGPFTSPQEYFRELEEQLSKYERCDAIDDLGGLGLEPVIYLLGSSAVALVSRVREIAEKVSSCSQQS